VLFLYVDSRYNEEKEQRKQLNKLKYKEQTIKYIKSKQQSNRDSYEALKYQLKKDASRTILLFCNF